MLVTRHRRRLALAATVLTAWMLVSVEHARAAQTPLACTQAAIENAIATGGDYLFNCSGTILLPAATPRYTIPADRTLTLDGTGHNVQIASNITSIGQLGNGFITVAGKLVLRRMQVVGFRTGSQTGSGGVNGTPGTAGTNGTPGTNASSPGGAGTQGGDGGNGGPGSPGLPTEGGAITVTPTGTLIADGVTFSNNSAYGGLGGEGGAGGAGGKGGDGAAGADAPNTGSGGLTGTPGGAAAKGGKGGNGGAAGAGADGVGGAISNHGTTTITGSTFSFNIARGGQGGFVNDGGRGGDGGSGGAGGRGYFGNGAPGGAAGAGGAGGNGGSAGQPGNGRGGAIYNTGVLDVADTTFSNNAARGGNSSSGGGGAGGWAGGGGAGGTVNFSCASPTCPPANRTINPQPGADGAAAAGGNGGNSQSGTAGTAGEGGAVYSTVVFTNQAGSTSDNVVSGGPGATFIGGVGGQGTPPGQHGLPLTQTQNEGSSAFPDFFPAPDSGAPKLDISGSPTVLEPTQGTEDATFEVTLRPPQTNAVTVDYATADNTATAGADYTARSGTLTFAPGETRKTVTVPVLADTDNDEDNETFFLDLKNETGGVTVTTRRGTATIQAQHKMSGTLLDKKGRPIAGATVLVHGIEEKSLTTDAAGNYSTRLYPGIYTVEPVAPPPGYPSDGSVFEPQSSDDCLARNATCFVNMTKDRVANFVLTFKVPVKGTVVDPVAKGIDGSPIKITGTDIDGKKVDLTATTDKEGAYSQLVAPGTYTVKAVAPENAVAPQSYQVTTCPGTKPSADACAVTLDKAGVTVDFKSECEPTINFQTSMIAKGCLIRTDAKGKVFKAKGPVRVNGIDFQAKDEKKGPITFNTQEKRVSSPDANFWLSRGGDKHRWLAFDLGALNQRFLGRTVRFTLASNNNLGPWSANQTVNSTLFGFPANTTGFEIESTAGRTTATLQLSLPPRPGARVDPYSGRWVAPNANGQMRSAYPNVGKTAVTMTNDFGIQTIEGTVQFKDVITFGAKAQNGVFGRFDTNITDRNGAPDLEGAIQIARVGFKYDFQFSELRLLGTVVFHKGTRTAALPSAIPKKVQDAIGTNGKGEGFLSAIVLDVDLGWRLDAKQQFFLIDRIKLSGNGLNKPLGAGLLLQRLGLDFGRDTDLPRAPLKFTLSGALTWGPRIRSDLWFQELLSLDVDGGIYRPTGADTWQIIGNAVLRGLNARLLTGRIVSDLGTGTIEVIGDASFNLREMITRLPASLGEIGFAGVLKLTFFNGASWFATGDGVATLFGSTLNGHLAWNDQVLGLCTDQGAGMWVDASYHFGPCDYDRFVKQNSRRSTATAAAATRSFTVRPGTKRLAVAIPGASPAVVLDGPGGLHVELPAGTPGASSGPVMLMRDTDGKRTLVFLADAPAGDYTVSSADGGDLGELAFADPLPPAKVSAAVKASGCRRQLVWKLTPHPGQVVRFFETGSFGRRLVATTEKNSGSATFTPAVGGGSATTRTIVAEVEQNRMPRATITAGRFIAPGKKADPVSALKGRLSGRRVTATWRGGCTASSYVVQATVGKKTFATTAKRGSASLTVPAKTTSAKVTVWAIDATQTLGPARSITVRAPRKR